MIHQGDALTVLRTLPDESVQMCVTSPPYFGLRDYGIPPTVWGGDPSHAHDFATETVKTEVGRGNWAQGVNGRGEQQPGGVEGKREPIRATAKRGFCECGAWLGTFSVQCASGWSKIGGTGKLQPTPLRSHLTTSPVKSGHLEDGSRSTDMEFEARLLQRVHRIAGRLQGVEDAREELSRDVASNGRARLRSVYPTSSDRNGENVVTPRRGADFAYSSARSVKPDHHLQCPVALIGDNPSPRGECPLNALGPAMASMDQARVTLWRDTDFAYSSSVTGREWTPSRGTLRSDWDREPRLSKHGVRRVPAREPSSLRFTETGRGPLAPWRPDLIAAHHLCGVDIPLLASLVGRESGWDPWALSKAGARGLTQVLPSTAAEFAPGMNLWNPAENLIVGGCWLRKLIDDYRGDVRTALHAYHAGGGTVRRKQVKQVTLNYADDVLGSAN